MTTRHPDFAKLAARISISNLHKVTETSFSTTMKRMYEYINPKTGGNAALLSKETYGIIRANAKKLDDAIDYNRDYNYDYFGYKTLERSYLMKIGWENCGKTTAYAHEGFCWYTRGRYRFSDSDL